MKDNKKDVFLIARVPKALKEKALRKIKDLKIRNISEYIRSLVEKDTK